MTMELPAIARIAAALVAALLISFIATPVVKSIAQMVGAVDVPKDNRRMHNHPIPRMGGLAIFLGFLLSTLIFVPMSSSMRGCCWGRDHRDPGYFRRHLRPARPAQAAGADCGGPGGGAPWQRDPGSVQPQYFQ
ncbi:MAG: hypothetical protein ACLR1T_04115 [Evtepia gabavorous]